MTWAAAILTVLKLLGMLLEISKTRQDTAAGRAQALGEAANEAIDLVNKAHQARIAADILNATPAGLRTNDGFKRE